MKANIYLFLAVLIFGSCTKDPEISSIQETQFLKYFGTSGIDIPGDILVKGDSYLMLGNEWSTTGQKATLYKVNNYGNLDWQKALNDSLDYTASAFATDDEGNIIVCGDYLNSFGYTDIFLIKLSPSYEVLWKREYGAKYDETATHLAFDATGNILVAGSISTDPNKNEDNVDALLMKISAEGDSVWTKSYGGSKYETASAIAVAADGNIFMVGVTESFKEAGQDKKNALLLKTNANGNLLDRASYGNGGSDSGEDIVIDTEGAIYLVGGVENSNGDSDAWICKISSDIHSPEWEKTSGFSRDDIAFSISLQANEPVIAGYSRNEQTGNKDTYLAKYDAQGLLMTEFRTGGEGDEYVKSVGIAGDGNPVFAGVSDFKSNAVLFLQKTVLK